MKLDHMDKLHVIDSFNQILRDQIELYIKNYKLLCFDDRNLSSMGSHDYSAIVVLRELGELWETIRTDGIDKAYKDITKKWNDDESYYDRQLRRLNDLKKEIEVIKKDYEKWMLERDEI